MIPLAAPGGMEVLIFLLLFSLPVLFVVFVVLLFRDVVGGRVAEALAELETRVAALEERLDRIEDGE
ncbi:MAG: hypothetical protein ACOCZC_01555 [Halodesulfurarchaeum sp.]